MNGIKRFFITCAGSDIETLELCPNTEQIKHAGFGTLVLIPAIVSFFSMSYAISTLTDNLYITFSAGFFWSFIIFSIDRFIVSSLHKPAIKENTTLNKKAKKNFKTGLILRIIFAGFIGVAVAHPITLLYFDYSIEDKLNDEFQEKIEQHQKQSENKISNIRQRENKIQKQIEKTKTFRDCLIELHTAEQSGNKVKLDCGSSSGIPGARRRADNIEERITLKNEEIKGLESQLFEIQESINNEIIEVENKTTNKIESFEKHSSRDYLAKTNALKRIAKTNSQTYLIQWFLMFFFIFLDILPVTLKAITKRGKYEELVDNQIHQVVEFIPYGYEKSKRDKVKKRYFDIVADKSINEMDNLSKTTKYTDIIDELQKIYKESVRGFFLRDKQIDEDIELKFKESEKQKKKPKPTKRKNNNFFINYNAEILIFVTVLSVTFITKFYTYDNKFAITAGTFALTVTAIFLKRREHLYK
ncbi:MAG: DUF4407 domain-containing protein [Bacteroidota bacterium]|nr:DUF4407 domain-containing protein [Bacteroidota bacterium]